MTYAHGNCIFHDKSGPYQALIEQFIECFDTLGEMLFLSVVVTIFCVHLYNIQNEYAI